MAFEVVHQGVVIRCDTPAEAAELVAQLTARTVREPAPPVPALPAGEAPAEMRSTPPSPLGPAALLSAKDEPPSDTPSSDDKKVPYRDIARAMLKEAPEAEMARAWRYLQHRYALVEPKTPADARFTVEVAILKCDSRLQQLINNYMLPICFGLRIMGEPTKVRRRLIEEASNAAGKVDVDKLLDLFEFHETGQIPEGSTACPTSKSPSRSKPTSQTPLFSPAPLPQAGVASPAAQKADPSPLVVDDAETGAWRQPPALDVAWGRFDSHSRTLVETIARRGQASLDELRDALELPTTKEVGVVIAAVKRVAKASGIPDYRHIFDYTIVGSRSNRTTFYHAGPLLRGEEV